MKIRIYQIDTDRDTQGAAFTDLDRLERMNGIGNIDSSIYDMVFEGEVFCTELEEVYEMFNLDEPEDFHGRSMSVSDVVEILSQDGAEEPGFYYCDSIGFQAVDFEPALTRAPEKGGAIRVVMVEPGKTARITEIGTSLESLQEAVGGIIEAYYPFEEEVCIVCNDEGKLLGMPLNRAIREEDREKDMDYGELTGRFREAEKAGKHLDGYVVFTKDSFLRDYPLESRTYRISSRNKAFQPDMLGYSIFGSSLDGSDDGVRLDGYMADEKGGAGGWKIERCYMKEPGREIMDIIAGPFFICGCRGESFGSLSEEQLRRYEEKYRYPEQFYREGNALRAVPFIPETAMER